MDPKIAAWVFAPILAAVLSGCAFSPPLTGSICPVGPFIGDPGASQRLTRAEKEYVIVLNESGKKICGWSEPSASSK